MRRHLVGIDVRWLLASAAGKMPAIFNAGWKPALYGRFWRWDATDKMHHRLGVIGGG